jgi:hypothetical protein
MEESLERAVAALVDVGLSDVDPELVEHENCRNYLKYEADNLPFKLDMFAEDIQGPDGNPYFQL